MLSAGECRGYLAQVGIGRVAVTVGALPAIFTVPFVLDGDNLLIRVAQLSLLRRALTGSVVAFSADDFEESEEDSWSVLVRGVGEDVGDEVLAVSLRALPLRSCSEAPERDCFVRFPLTQLSGTRAHWPDAVVPRQEPRAPKRRRRCRLAPGARPDPGQGRAGLRTGMKTARRSSLMALSASSMAASIRGDLCAAWSASGRRSTAGRW